MRLIWIFIGLALIMIIPFALFGDMGMGEDRAIEFLRNQGSWAWLVAMLLLSADLLLPVPATAIIGALGFIYGPVVGAILGATGSFISANIAYWICRKMGRPMAEKLVGRKDLIKGEHLFKVWGGWLVTLTRWLPLFPEVISCLAGMTRMPWKAYAVATMCGVVPLSVLFSWIGHMGQDDFSLSLILSLSLPPLFWAVLQAIMKKQLQSIERQTEVTPAPTEPEGQNRT